MIFKKRIPLLWQSVFIYFIFVLMLFISQYFLIHRILVAKQEAKKIQKIKTDEIFLYQDNLKNLTLLFSKEFKEIENLNYALTSKIEQNFINRKISKIQRLFNKFYNKNFFIDHIFLFNKFGRLLAFTPYNGKFHNNIYDYPEYYKYIKNKIIVRKKTFTYFYLFDENVIKNNFKKDIISQPPFLPLKKMKEYTFNKKLSHSILEYNVNENKELKQPFFIVASPIFLNRTYWGMNCFSIPFSYFINKLKNFSLENLFFYFVLTDTGYLFYYPEYDKIGSFAGKDKLVKKIFSKMNEFGDTGFLQYKDKIVFYHKNNNLIFVGIPFKYLGLSDSDKPKYKFPSFLWLFFAFEFFLLLLLFLLFYSKILFSINYLINKYKSDGLKNLDEFSKIENIINSKQKEKFNLIKNKIVNPAIYDAYKLHSSDFDIPFNKVNGIGVFISVHNIHSILDKEDSGIEFFNKFVSLIYDNANKFDGYVEHLSFISFIVYFGVPFIDMDASKKSYNFIINLLKSLNDLNKSSDLDIKIGISVDKGDFVVSKFVYSNEEEIVITGDIITILQRYETIAADNVAIIGEDFYNENVVDKNLITETAEIKIRDIKKLFKVFVLKV